MDPTEGGTSSESPLLGLPNELVFEVTSYLEDFKDLNCLVRTSQSFHRALNPHLYRRAVSADIIVLDGIVRWVLSKLQLASLTLLLDNGLSVDYTLPMGTMLHCLCGIEECSQKRSVPLARLLIQRGADMEVKDATGSIITVLHNAIFCNNCEIAALLLAHGADLKAVNHRGETPLHRASHMPWDNDEMVRLLIAHGANIEARCDFNDTPLIVSSMQRNFRVMAALLEHGADAGVHNKHGVTVLHLASMWFNREHHELAKSLLVHGAVVDATDLGGQTPLHSLSSFSKDGIFMTKFLLENGADVNATTNAGLSPLHYCALSRERRVDLAALLLENGALINATDIHGRTPLRCLLQPQSGVDRFMAKFLLENGADVNSVSDDGRTVLQYALRGYIIDRNIVALLLEHGADISGLKTTERRLVMQMRLSLETS
jgi:ankyrin repeat protein